MKVAQMRSDSTTMVPLTSGQRELWLASRVSMSEYAETSIRACYIVDCNLCPDILRETLRRVLLQTPLLGVTFDRSEVEPRFVLGGGAPLDLRCVDMRGKPDPQQAAHAFLESFFEESVEDHAARFALIRTAESESIYALKCSHLVMDGLGAQFHAGLVGHIYAALAQGCEPELDPPCSCDAQYLRDREHCASARFAKDMVFWSEHLEKMPEKRLFRARCGYPDVLGDSRFEKHILSREASACIDRALQQHQISPAVYFTALHVLVVSFMCGEPNIVVQTPVALGERKSFMRRQGAQIAMPPMLVDVTAHETVQGVFADVAAQNSRFFRHANTPYQLAMRNLSHKNLAYLADTFVNYLPFTPAADPYFPLRRMDQWHSEREPVLFGILVMREPVTGQFSLTVRSSRNHLSRQDVERYVQRVCALAHRLEANPALGDLSFLLDEEEDELRRWQRGETKPYAVCTMHALFDQRAAAFADQPAVCATTGEVLTYAQVRERSLRYGAWLAAQGVKKGDVVAVLARRVPNLPEVVLGIMRCGAIYLPIDPAAPAERCAFIAADANAVLTVDLADTRYLAEQGAVPHCPTSPGDAAYLIYTSGSTGRPKGVLAPHAGFVNMILGQIDVFAIMQSDHVLQFAPPIFDASLSEMFMALYAGACLYPVDDAYRNEPWTLKDYMTANGVTVVTLPPSYLHLFDREAFPGLRVLITAGEPPVVSDALHYAASLNYFNAYGPTETCVCASIKRVAADEPTPISSGRPIPNATACILDAHGRVLPAGIVGELWVGGASLSLGYHGNSNLTRQRFRHQPALGGQLAYATGDLATWSETGELQLVGRADDQVKIRGNRVELGEVTFLLESCDGVSQAVALALHADGGQAILGACVVLRTGVSLDDVVTWSRAHLPAYMIPSRWLVLPVLPVTPTGKIDRNSLKKQLEKMVMAPKGQVLDPRLAAIFHKVLGESFVSESSFFDQGGDSLKAMSFLHEVRSVFGVDIPFRVFVTCDSLFAVQGLLQGTAPKAEAPLPALIPLSRNQYQLWAYQQVNAQTIDYNMPLWVEARGENAARFVESLQAAIDAQDLFRCTIGGAVDRPHFVSGGVESIPVQVLQADAAADVGPLFAEIIHTPFDLRHDAPVRMAVVHLPESVHVLLVLHHIVGDGESIDLILQNALRHMQGEKMERVGLGVQVAFCRRESAYRESAAYKTDEAYWKNVLTPVAQRINASQIRTGAMAGISLPAVLADGLEGMAQQTGSTVLACFVALLARFLGEQYSITEVPIGVPVGLRETQEEFGAVGFFVNTVPLRVACNRDEDASTTCRRTGAALREAIAHSRFCDTGFVPEFLATYVTPGTIEAPGLAVQTHEPHLKASKFTASFLLQAAHPGQPTRLVMEYDAGFITDAPAMLEELAIYLSTQVTGGQVHDPVQVLRQAWRDILQVAPDAESDFFRDGGDSIKAIQITGVLHRHAIHALTAADFLRVSGFGALCAVLDAANADSTIAPIAYPVAQPGERVPLLPLHHQLLQQHPEHWKQFFMMLSLDMAEHVPANVVQDWVSSLPARHESLQMAFGPAGAVLLAQPQNIHLHHQHFGPETDEVQLCRAMVRQLAGELDPETGHTLAAGLAEQSGRRLLVLVGHHLVLDTFSLDVLRQDLANVVGGHGRMAEVHGMASRALGMEALLAAGAFPAPQDAVFWEAVCHTSAGRLAGSVVGRQDRASARVFATRQLEGFNLSLTQTAVADLLSALAVALHGQGQREPVFVTLESHGRDDMLPGFDASHTLGWFTAVCPMPLAPVAHCAEAHKVVAPWIREVFNPAQCNTFGYLRQMEPERFHYDAQIGFNYFGKMTGGNAAVSTRAALAMPGAIPELLHPDFEPDAPLELVAYFDAAGVLHFGAFHSPEVIPASWVGAVLDGWATALQTLPAYRPPLPEALQASIAELCRCPRHGIADIQVPEAGHESLLYQSLREGRGHYTVQVAFHFTGVVDDMLLVRAWNTVAARHETFCSLFPMPHPGEFYRVVLRSPRMALAYHDLSHLPPDMTAESLDTMLLDQRVHDFNLATGPLLRVQLVRLDDGRFVLGWCFHHVLMDGWCMGVLLHELFTAYGQLAGGGALALPAPADRREYERWVAALDVDAAKRYWAGLLEGFTTQTGVVPAGRGVAANTGDDSPGRVDSALTGTDVDPVTMELELDERLSNTINAVASNARVTLSVLVQTLWSVVLSTQNNHCRDVVYGVVASGRPAEVPGMERAVGLFIQSLPLRVRWSPSSELADLLQHVKEQGLQQMVYGYQPVAEMGRNLWDHLMVVENYPFKASFLNGDVELVDVQGFEKIPYPFGISVIPSPVLRFRFLYDPSRLSGEDVAVLGRKLHAALQAVAVMPSISCAELEACISAHDVVDEPDAHEMFDVFDAHEGLDAFAGGGAPVAGTTAHTVTAAHAPHALAVERSGGAGTRAASGAELAASPVPAQVTIAGGDTLETAIQRMYESILGCTVPDADADFFLYGGHSLLAMRLLARISRDLGVKVSIDDIMAHATPRSLAVFMQGKLATVQRMSRVERAEAYPLSASQGRFWFLQRLHQDDCVYVIPFAARLQAGVDRHALQRALTLLEERHDALRMRVAADVPEQKPMPAGSLLLEVTEAPFNPQMPVAEGIALGWDSPLVRATLHHPPGQDPILLLRLHHIIFDGWSAEILLREINIAYEAVLRGSAPAWQPLELDYASYVVCEKERQVANADALRNWLLPLPERLELPLDFSRPATPDYAGRVFVFMLPPEKGQGLKAYARKHGVTLFPVLVALVKAFLFKHTGQTDIVVGCPAANREADQTQDMVGLFVNTLVLRTHIGQDRNFGALVGNVNASFQLALAAQAYPFEKLVEDLGVERNPARNPLFDVFVAQEDATWSDYSKPPLHMQSIPLQLDRSKFDISFYFKEGAASDFEVHMEYSTALFTEQTIQRMSQRFMMLVDSVLAESDTSLWALPMLPPAEAAAVAAFNATAEPFDLHRSTDTCFSQQVARTPDAPALHDHEGQLLTYAAFDAAVGALAEYLAGAGLARGQYACVCLERSSAMMLAIYAVARLGAIYVPLATVFPAARMLSVCEDLGACVVITEPALAGLFATCGQPVIVPDMQNLPGGYVPPAPCAPDDVAYVLFTSGSTGRPKGVQVEQRALCNRLEWMQSRFPLGAGDVILQKTTVAFDVSVWELFWWSRCGASLALLAPQEEKNPEAIVDAVCRHGVTVMHFVPSMLRAFVEYLEANRHEVQRLASLRYVFTSGEALSGSLVARYKALVATPLHNLYGPTEATIDVTWYPCADHAAQAVPIGRPISNTRMHVLDAHGQMQPLGVAGELYISGVQVARGYVNRQEQTERAFLPDPFLPGERMYRTGDLGRWLADGNIEYLGRNDDQVKVRGYRIELGEVEAALNGCDGISQAVVRVCTIGGYTALEAFLLPQTGQQADLLAVRKQLASTLPEYMHPARYHVVDVIPLSPSGKADRKRLEGRPLLPQPGAAGQLTALQEEVRTIWRIVMPEVDVQDIDQGFFEIGGNSLLLVQLQARLQERWPGVFTLAGLFAESTIRKQAHCIGQVQGATTTPSTVVSSGDAPVAIIGMGVRFGDYEDAERFWQDLAGGVDMNVPLPEVRRNEVRQIFEAVGYAFDASRLREAAYLADIASFDYRRFGLAPGDAAMLDPKQRLFMEVALQALDDAGYGGAALENGNVGVFVGASPYRLFQDAVSRSFPEQAEQIYLLNVPSNVVARISYLKNWNGSAATVDTACSSVLRAVHDACLSLRAGECAAALVGGVHTIDLPVKADRTFTIEAASGRTRTFDAKADGVGAGEGAAVFVLKLLEHALADNDPIHAVIAGSAVNQDGRSSSMAAPNPAAQADVIARAARNASVALADVDFFEAHGTATILGDPVEVEALGRAFAREGQPLRRKALIGSVKGNLGHLDAAAGAAGLAKAVLSLKKGLVPPQPHFESPNPHIDFDVAPVRVAQTLEALNPEDRPWTCGVSSFGLSGVNTHVIVREHAPAPLPQDDGGWYCVPVSAHDEDGLQRYCRALHEAISSHAHWPVHAIAATLVSGRDHLDVRAVAVVSSRGALLDWLAAGITPARCARVVRHGVVAARFADKEHALDAAAAYMQGQALVWNDGQRPHKVHLPATPFTRTYLWPRFVDAFLAAPVQTPSGTAHAVAIAHPAFWPVAEHRLNGVPTLVGMALLDLISRAVQRPVLSLENIRWQRPVVNADDAQATLFVTPTMDAVNRVVAPVSGLAAGPRVVPVADPTGDPVSPAVSDEAPQQGSGAATIELHHRARGKWHVAARAYVPAGEPQCPAPLAVAQLLEGMQPLKVQGGAVIVAVSKRWLCREELWGTPAGDRLLARIVLPEQFRRDLHSFRWHPAMADIAASLALHGAVGFVPARCGSAHLYRPMPATVYAHAVITDRQRSIITAECTVVDTSGNVIMALHGLEFVSLMDSAHEPELYDVHMQHIAMDADTQSCVGKLLLLGNGGNTHYATLVQEAQMCCALPATPEESRKLAEALLEAGIDHVLYLAADGDAPWALARLLQDVARAGLRSALHVTAVGQGALVADGHAPEGALALGLLQSLRHEDPHITCSYVDMAQVTPASVGALRSALGQFDGAVHIGAGGELGIHKLTQITPSPWGGIGADGCVVITGAPGGMAMTLAGQITARTGAQVVLLHRRAEGVGDQPHVAYHCDVTDAEQVNEVFAHIRQHIGPIQGVIHAAGLAGNGYLLSRSQEQYDGVLAPKYAGTWNLHHATIHDNLAFFVLASSRTALLGAPGQCDYAAANAFLNGFALYRRAQGLPALSICWNTWADVGMAARMQAADNGFMLRPEQAFDVLDRALGSGCGVVAVAMPGEAVSRHALTTLRNGVQQAGGDGTVEATAATAVSAMALSASGGAGSGGAHAVPCEGDVLEIIRDCLGYDAPLGREDDFFDLGGDSIAGTRIVSRIDKELGISVGVIDLLESDTLGDFVDSVLAGVKAQSSPQPGMKQAPAREKYPVGREQISILYADLLGEAHLAYNLPAFLQLPPDVDTQRLEQALGVLVQRHEVLRTSFCDFDAEHPSMIIHPYEGFTLAVEHIPDLAAKDALIRPFDLKRERGFRVCLLVVGGEEKLLFYDIHHALADGRTISLLNAELYQLYHGRQLEPVRMQQKDFAWHQFTQDISKDKEYWLERFAGALPMLDIPSDFVRPPVHTNRGGMYEMELAPDLVASIKELARNAGVTSYHVVLTAWSLLLHAYAKTDDVVISITVDSRNEYHNTAGMLASLLPLRLAVDDTKPLRALLADNQRVSNEALRHGSYVLNNLLADLKPPVCPGRSLLSEVILSYMNFEFASGEQQLFETLRFSKHASKTDLSIFVSDVGSGIGFAIEYYADLFSHENIVRMGEDFVCIVQAMVAENLDGPVVFSGNSGCGHSMGTVRTRLDPALCKSVSDFAQQRNVPPQAVMLATFAALVSRATGEEHLAVGYGTGRYVGCHIDATTEFETLLAATHQQMMAFDVCEKPHNVFSVDECPATGVAANNACAGDVPAASLRVAFAFMSDAQGGSMPANPACDLLCIIEKYPDGIDVRFDHRCEALAADTASDWLGYYEQFLEGIARGSAA